MTAPTPRLRLAVALDGAGWHPAAWREPNARPGDLLTPGYWADIVQEAEAGLLDFVTIEDSLSIQTDAPFGAEDDDRTDRVRGRLDAVLLVSRIAPLTRHIGIVPTAVVTHTEPFHLSKAIATLDYVSRGRAGVRVQVAPRARDAALFGRREFPEISYADLDSPAGEALLQEAFDEATDYVEVLRRLWDSWEDDAEIRDVATGRFIDRDKIHYIDFEGLHFDVKGPSITPRPPQGQPVVAALAHRDRPFELVGRSADVGFVTPRTPADIASITARIRTAQDAAGRSGETVHVFGDLVVVLDETEQGAQDRLARLDEAAGATYESDALVFTGTPAALADLLATWHAAGLSGFRLRPAVLPHDLRQITQGLVPELQRRGLFHDAYEATTLRGALGLPRPTSRYATTEGTPA
ncbi:LLM class flavin-dependent oxidoreductase [Nocardioides sp. KC13]|uniref:LLM class flavin-dependent oxidoreductase n=1 Tax=Nocardioides turkmenicus TaxID=2711220 RepID=A0A6M1R5G6_9ACTN|nr:LLM class flavin-dependent oxidoreductase [Nocardioides sp. KC13]NGN95534.1 LLM class flavin-dependent oxidoreductase [Nocardioides sp. KC13]